MSESHARQMHADCRGQGYSMLQLQALPIDALWSCRCPHDQESPFQSGVFQASQKSECNAITPRAHKPQHERVAPLSSLHAKLLIDERRKRYPHELSAGIDN